MSTVKLSVVVCVYNEEENIKPQIERIAQALEAYEYEMVFVDDGSKDNTLRELYSVEHPRLRVVELKKNYGQSLALMAGIDYAQGEYIATMDGDLQNDPSDLPRMLKIAEEGGFDMVAGNRANRKDGMVLRKIPSRIANYIIRSLTDVHLKDYGCALKVLKADLAKDLGLYGELHRFVPVLAHLEGARITQVDVKHHARQFGTSKYGLSRTFKVISDLLLMLFFKKYMQKPMHLFGNAGIFLFIGGMLINFYLLVVKLMGYDIWGRPILILGMMMLFGGIQFITIGIVVEIQMRTYFESQRKKPYKVRKVQGFEGS
ncbi:MAG TPA: glycosyltransferase family 2 protein [Haliscomenobacter sp.]|uniref:glycosyltransferase family 2 protein n=1 Tax=Haliscomenobacter sp. TaxID=2717303 RepID=UPI002BB29655|nr:glycosyltransferase family 2 protein [Haliscomenobacter sp.]HOY17544.1 glycosyltransferase family 2 protein [Haliscomenobacter sp.]HPH17836.1 glycosyltransferase family 2 protein [Haliscomenobacter sp.]